MAKVQEKKAGKEQEKEKSELGLTADKDELSEWYSQILQKAELIEYSPVSGCYILRPRLYAIWEKVQSYFDKKIKEDGVKNCYFPLFIPESLLLKEKEHVEGFSPEVAWVTQTGNTKLSERLAIRPTSESIMYPAYAKWIRSYRDLPLRLNQWCNVVRWEFKHPLPLLRSREFLWQEGHTAFANPEEAEKEAYKIQQFYADTFREMYAMPIIKGRKTEKEKFAGALYTLTTEAFLPSGRSAQAATSHHLGQNFSKVFNIKFKTKDQKEDFVWQNSWGISTRSIGIAIMMHSDSKGLVLPPRVASPQAMIIPIFKEEKERKEVMKEAENLKKMLGNEVEIEIDSREQTPGFKFNDAELKGIPLRIEIGPRDLKENQVVVARRDTGEKENIKVQQLLSMIPQLLEKIHQNLCTKAENYLKESTARTKNLEETKKAVKNKKLVKTMWCGNQACEDQVKSETSGAKIICILEEEKPGKQDKCVNCQESGKYVILIARSY